jgi:hypothetical protein
VLALQICVSRGTDGVVIASASTRAEALLRKIDGSRSPALHIQACAEARMIRRWRERVELVPELLFLAGISVLRFTVIISSAIFIDYAIHH